MTIRSRTLVTAFAVAAIVGTLATPTPVAAADWVAGDIFVGGVPGSGYQVFTSVGVKKDTIPSGPGGGNALGCAFDYAGRFYGTFSPTAGTVDPNAVYRYDGVDPHAAAPFGSGYAEPNAVALDSAGRVYVGGLGSGIRQFDATGALLRTVTAARVDAFDIAADQDTIIYTQFGSMDVKRLSIATGAALPAFSIGTHRGDGGMALRILADGGLLLADATDVKRYDASGQVVQTYTAAGETAWTTLSLDPSGTSFWAGSFLSGNIRHLDIATGAVDIGPIRASLGREQPFGLCVRGDLPQSAQGLTLTPTSGRDFVGTARTFTATATALGQPMAGVPVAIGVIGANAGSGACTTDATGQCTFSYAGTKPGTDTVKATATVGGRPRAGSAVMTWDATVDLTARFDWSMPDRTRSTDGVLIDAYFNLPVGNALGGLGSPPLIDNFCCSRPDVSPGAWRVDLDACASVTSSGAVFTSYRFTSPAALQPSIGSDCHASLTFPAQGTYPVTLTISDSSGAQATVTHDVTVKDYLVVSLGDSYGSGQGNPPYQDQRCARSTQAASAQTALWLERRDPKTSVTFVHLACSGAQIHDWHDAAAFQGGMLDPYAGSNPVAGEVLPTQLHMLKSLIGDRKIDFLMLSIGGNDMGFGGIVSACTDLLFLADFPHWLQLPNCYVFGQPGAVTFDRGIQRLPSAYQDLADGFASAGLTGPSDEPDPSSPGERLPILSPERIYITEYADSTRDDSGTSCGWPHLTAAASLPGFDAAEHGWGSLTVVRSLDDAVAHAASSYQWNYVGGISPKFLTHGYCADDHWVRRLQESFLLQGNQDGTFHPNRPGQDAIRDSLTDLLARHLANPPTPPSVKVYPLVFPFEIDVAGANGWFVGRCAPLLGTCGPGQSVDRGEVDFTVLLDDNHGLSGFLLFADGAPVTVTPIGSTGSYLCAMPLAVDSCNFSAAAGADPKEVVWTIHFKTRGTHQLLVLAANVLGKRITTSVERKVDLDPPSLDSALVTAGTPGANGWYRSPVDVTFRASDLAPGSGLNRIDTTLRGEGPSGGPAALATSGDPRTGPVVAHLTTEGDHFVVSQAVDFAELRSTPDVLEIKIDLTPPVLVLPAPVVVNATGPAGAVVAYGVTASDNLDPHPAVSCSGPPSGATFPPGTTIVACVATDQAGNSTGGSFPVTVRNTPPGANVAVSLPDPPGAPVTVTFDAVTAAGTTTLTTSSGGAAPPSGFGLGTPPTYFDIATTATFSGGVTVCIPYGALGIVGAPRLFHYEGSPPVWVDATTSVDTAAQVVCGRVTSFSPFIVATDVAAPITTGIPAPAPNANGWNNTSVTILLSALDQPSGASSSGVRDIVVTQSDATTAATVATTTIAGDRGSVTVDRDGTTNVTYFARDGNGNAEAPQTLVIRIDRTAPEAVVRFDPQARDLAVFARDTLSGADAAAVPPAAIAHTAHDEDARIEVRTYRLADRAGNTLELVVSVQSHGGELAARIDSLRYRGAAPLAADRNLLSVEWSPMRPTTSATDAIAELAQRIELGNGEMSREAIATFDARKDRTVIQLAVGERERKLEVPGLALLNVATDQGRLSIEIDGTPLPTTGPVDSDPATRRSNSLPVDGERSENSIGANSTGRSRIR